MSDIIINQLLNSNIIQTDKPTNTPTPTTISTPTISTPTISTPTISSTSDIKSIYAIFHTFISILAIYLSLRCNPKINYTSILIALFLPYPYVIYSVIMHNGICKA
jgi:hypothetical protein